jgi:molybdopterin-guanine dinucleotide biosynthesis protein A
VELPPFAAIVLAGGRGTRLGGVHKPGLRIGDRTFLDRVLDAVAGAAPVIVVGPDQPVPATVTVTREDPPGGGPVAALAAGLPLVGAARRVAVLAADLPFLTPATITALREACTADGAVLVDAGGRDQYLAGVWRVAALRRALASLGDPRGAAMRRLVGGLAVTRVGTPGGSDAPAPWFDCDDPQDLDEAKRWL